MTRALLDFTGFAARSDLEKEEWRSLFSRLESAQFAFLKHQDRFRSKEYRWPKDPLHTWSRLWEYPYVFHHIQKAQEQKSREQRAGERLRILDFGSGVTFFPFAVATLGCDVVCADIDPVVAVDIPEAVKRVQHTPGIVDVALIEDARIPIESESQNVVYCISVLEHISAFESAIEEMARVLEPGGNLILTVDIDLQGNCELGVNEFLRLQTTLDEYFMKKLPERPVHPSNLLTTVNSHYQMKSWSPISEIKRLIKGALRGKWAHGGPRVGFFLTVYAAVYQKLRYPRNDNNREEESRPFSLG